MATTDSRPPASDWPLLKDRWLDAVDGSGGDAQGGPRAAPDIELHDEARSLLRRQGAAAQVSQYFEVHLAHG